MTAQIERPARPRVPGTPPSPGRRLGGLLRSRPHLTPYLLVLPAVLLELLIHIIPMVVGIVMSFIGLTQFYIRNWSSAPFVGLGNYRIALDFNGPIGQELLHSFLITIVYTVIVVGVSWVLGMAAALVLQRSFRGRGGLRTLFLVPYALPIYAGVITWSFMFQRDNGLINHILQSNLHLIDSPSFWLIGNNAFVAMAVVAIWRSWPFAFLMLTAGMQSIPDDLYDASAVDGAGVWRQSRYITMAMLRPVNVVLVLMLFLWTFNDFNTPFVLFGANAPEQADIISIHIYANSFVNWNFGLGSAMSVLLLLFLLLCTVVWFLIAGRRARRA
ncbi:MAG TPA: sugar ABC transporter permease [Nocardioidaceae bacterium]|nr:sugar ABC transporter permease [Nocardioidaceae bacterium]